MAVPVETEFEPRAFYEGFFVDKVVVEKALAEYSVLLC
jgi:hypothetical protein